eukprot:1453081-Amphidinium_carterae.1
MLRLPGSVIDGLWRRDLSVLMVRLFMHAWAAPSKASATPTLSSGPMDGLDSLSALRLLLSYASHGTTPFA